MYYKDVVNNWVQENETLIIESKKYTEDILLDLVDRFDVTEDLYLVASYLYKKMVAIYLEKKQKVDTSEDSGVKRIADFCTLGNYTKISADDLIL